MMDIRELSWQHASTLSEDADMRKVLEWFVNRVREGKTVNAGVMEFIAAGVEQHLAGKKPWGAKRGAKKNLTLQDAYTRYAEYQRVGAQHLATGKPFDPRDILTHSAENLEISEDTMQRAIDTAKANMHTSEGRQAQYVLLIAQALKTIDEEK